MDMISTSVINNIFRFASNSAGDESIFRALRSVDIPETIVDRKNLYIPQKNYISLLESCARNIGDEFFGFHLAIETDVSDWGTWGRYVITAPTLERSLLRAEKFARYIASGDEVRLMARGDTAILRQRPAYSGQPGHHHYVACVAQGIVSAIRHYLGRAWTPLRIELNIPPPRRKAAYEDLFRCPVVFDAEDVAVHFSRHHLRYAPLHGQNPVFAPPTFSELRRLVQGGGRTDLTGRVLQVIRLHLLDGQADIDRVAQRMAIGPRTLQRRLSDEGRSYRSLVSLVRAERAVELLTETQTPITEISIALGYSSPAHFTRAFIRSTGNLPSSVRRASRHP